MVAPFGVMLKNFCLAAVGSWTIPVVAWFEGIIHHKSEIFVVK
jgi:hypothetical protein